MTHRDNWRDVGVAFDYYRALTSHDAELQRDGPLWRINEGAPILADWHYGAASMLTALRAYCAGWEAAPKEDEVNLG